MAVPIRTVVAPSSIAVFISPDIPIDNVSSSNPASCNCLNRAFMARKGFLCLSGSVSGSGMAINPRSFRRGITETALAKPGRFSGEIPLLLVSPLMLIWRQIFRGGRSAGRWSESRFAILSRSTEWTQSKYSAIARVLLL